MTTVTLIKVKFGAKGSQWGVAMGATKDRQRIVAKMWNDASSYYYKTHRRVARGEIITWRKVAISGTTLLDMGEMLGLPAIN